MTSPTLSQYGDFQAAFQHFNLELFGGALPDTMLTLAKTRHASGYVIPDGFHVRGQADGEKTPEIGLNPQRFANRTAEQVLGALVCEMVKLAQHMAGTGSPDGYLNKDYHRRVEFFGMSATGESADQGGLFHTAALQLLAEGWAVKYVAPTLTKEAKQRQQARKASKTKYTCPVSGLNAWAKPGAVLYTGPGALTNQPMIAEAE